MNNFKLSIVIPTHQENDDTYLVRMASEYPTLSEIEYIVVDSGTDPDLFDSINRSDFRVLRGQAGLRSEKLNKGFQEAQGDIIFFHHPRSLVDPKGFEYLIENTPQIGWGGFTHKFDQKSPGLLFTSWYSNKVRPKLWKVLYLDHCVFFIKPRIHFLHKTYIISELSILMFC